MPVRKDFIGDILANGDRGNGHEKPVYFCEACGVRASYGFNVMIDNRRRRLWYCGAHRNQGEMQIGKHEHDDVPVTTPTGA